VPRAAEPATREAAAPAESPRPAGSPHERHRDRLFPMRLLVVIVIAALIGSVLVLLLR
jgi:hypothetical protein